jgi:hypothetical protein
MIRRVLLALALLTASCAIAQTVPVSATLDISWTAPTTADGGTEPLTGPNVLTSYNVYASTVALTTAPTSPTVTATAGTTTATGSISALVGQTIYVYVTACNSSGCSGLSSAATYTIPVQGFGADPPTNVSITVKIAT